MAKFQPSPHKEEIMEALRQGATIDDIVNRFPVSERTVRRYLAEIGREKPPKEREGGKLATFVTKQCAPVVFVLGEQRIELEPEAIYGSYLLHEDIKLRCSLNDNFSNVLRDGAGLLWRILASEPVIEKEPSLDRVP